MRTSDVTFDVPTSLFFILKDSFPQVLLIRSLKVNHFKEFLPCLRQKDPFQKAMFALTYVYNDIPTLAVLYSNEGCLVNERRTVVFSNHYILNLNKESYVRGWKSAVNYVCDIPFYVLLHLCDIQLSLCND